MYLKACPGYKGKIYLSFVQGYRDENGKVKQKTVEKIGYLEDLKKLYEESLGVVRTVLPTHNLKHINKANNR